MIPFNKPYLTGKETSYIEEAVRSGKISGDGIFTKRCHDFFEQQYGLKKCLLTTSCTAALEMAAILVDIQPGDEVIMPSYTFTSTANAFMLRGAKIAFADSRKDNPNMDERSLSSLVSDKTKAIVVVHYAGIACDMDAIMQIANSKGIYVIEDAAQAIDSYYKGKPLGSIGHLATFSFHETKNLMAGEGGMLVINDNHFAARAEIIREKGTNRSAFFRGEIDKYGWVDVGSSYLPSDIIAAFLYAQIEKLSIIQNRRKEIWQSYYKLLAPLQNEGLLRLPVIPGYASNNAHMFYLVCQSAAQREQLIKRLKEENIQAIFHYQSLHNSSFYKKKHDGRPLPMSELYTSHLLRLPMFYELSDKEVVTICESVKANL